MKIWIDAQLPPTLANWLTETFDLDAEALRDLALRDARDLEIFEAAREEFAVIMTKDSDFIDLVCRLGSPPQILWLTIRQCHKPQLTAIANCYFARCVRGIATRRNDCRNYQSPLNFLFIATPINQETGFLSNS